MARGFSPSRPQPANPPPPTEDALDSDAEQGPSSSGLDSLSGLLNGPVSPAADTHHAADYADDDSGVRFPFLLPPVQPDEIGRLGNYRVLKLLGVGGMAYVFQAEDVALRRPVALKVMKPELDQFPDSWQRFLREARIMASLKHDHLVTVYQVGQEGNAVYLAMELLQGQSLAQRMRTGVKPDLAEVLRLGREIASGLIVIHRNGLIHRDLKPANLWLEEPGGRVKVLDFGLARGLDDDAHLTKSGLVVGTPAFMSPEQGRGEPADQRSDLFSLGGILYYLCTGHRPFHGDTTMAVLTALAVSDPVPVQDRNPHLPAALADLIAQLLEKEPAARPATAQEVIERLQAIDAGAAEAPPKRATKSRTKVAEKEPRTKARKLKTPKPSKRPPRRRWAFVMALVAALVVAAASAVAVAWWALGMHRGPTAEPVFLTALPVVENQNPVNRPPGPPNMPPPPFDGVRVQGRLFSNGIFMHPPTQPNGGTSSLSVKLGKQFKTFRAGVSLNDGPPQSDIPLTFTVLADGRRIWESRPVRRQADADACDLDVKGVDVLTIAVNCPGFPRGAHAVWTDPTLGR